MMTDPVADLLTRIRNAGTARHLETLCPSSKLKVAIASLLKEEGVNHVFQLPGSQIIDILDEIHQAAAELPDDLPEPQPRQRPKRIAR